ncbi:MAG: 16S rRNA (guanine(966)-N(2))-methyltransferase RsmD [Methylovulum sp.]|nr:16S rRNA (guanine(966)-N(2))-methyltransferase RsmD [Methylovulum sp.]
MQNKLRIIGGQWRSRQVHFTNAEHLRPTPARVRETLFNWLHHDIVASRCLDCYAGSGALSFEAASRGAAQVVLIDHNPDICRTLKANADVLKAKQIKIINSEVLRYLSGNSEPYDLVFLDPPFGQGLVVPTCHWLEDKLWLKAGAKVYVETERHLDLITLPENWDLIKSKTAGDVAYRLYQRSE